MITPCKVYLMTCIDLFKKPPNNSKHNSNNFFFLINRDSKQTIYCSMTCLHDHDQILEFLRKIFLGGFQIYQNYLWELHRFMYIAYSSNHSLITLNLPFKVILRMFEVIFWYLECEYCTFQMTDENSFRSTQTTMALISCIKIAHVNLTFHSSTSCCKKY